MRQGSGLLWASETHGILCEALKSLLFGVANEMANGGPFNLLPQPSQWWFQPLHTQNRVASFLNPDRDNWKPSLDLSTLSPSASLAHLNLGVH